MFPPDIDENNIHSFILQYQSHIDSVIEDLKCICGYCGLFTLEKKSHILAMDDYLIHNSVMSELLVTSNINSCGNFEGGIYLCFTCKKLLLLGNQPKFGILNGLPCIDCQSYPFVLADLFIPEKAFIAHIDPVVSILKLRPSGILNPAAYPSIKRHAVFLPQNPSLLLTFLPSPTLVLYDVIYIVWAGWGHFTNLDLRHFILVRKQTLLNTLTWLQINNLLYWDVVINHDILSSMPDKYIFKGILLRLIIMEYNNSKCKSYGADLVENNNKNNLYHAIRAASINKLGIMSGCIYIDVNKSRQNPYLKLISAIYNLSDDNAAKDYNDNLRPVISYNFYGNRKPLND